MPGSRTRAVQERRRSNAAGPHTSTSTRAQQLADAISDQLDTPDDDTTDDTSEPQQHLSTHST